MDFNTKFNLAKTTFYKLNKNDEESWKKIAIEISSFSSYNDIDNYLKFIRKEPMIFRIKSFGFPVILGIFISLFVKIIYTSLDKLMEVIPFYNDLTDLEKLGADFFIIILVCLGLYPILKSIFSPHVKFQGLLENILICGDNLYGINLESLKEKDRPILKIDGNNNEIIFGASGTGRSRFLENKKIERFEEIARYLKGIFDYLSILLIVLGVNNPFSPIYWFFLVVFLLLSPFALYFACGEERKAEFRKFFKI